MSSARCPGKVLAPILGKPLLDYLVESLLRCRSLDSLTVATSMERSDDAIEEFCRQRGVDCFRGSLDNVAQRFQAAAEHGNCDAFARISGDSPLMDHRLVDQVVDLARRTRCDLATNVRVRTFPSGQSVEVVNVHAFHRALKEVDHPADREHVTTCFYRQAHEFHVENIQHDPPAADVRLTVDTADDLIRVKEIMARFDRPHWKYSVPELVNLYREIDQSPQQSNRSEAA